MAGASLGLTVASQGTAVSMQTGTIDYSAHPMCGCWLAMANPLLPEDPQLPVPSFFFPNGFAIFSFPVA
jgi:hypothetical protein